MMKKMFLFGLILALSAPVFAADKTGGPKGAKNGPRLEMKDDQAKAARKAMKAQRKATEEKLEKLVKEYKSAKDGSKKQAAAKAEIASVLGAMRDEQINMRAKNLEGFENRLADMKDRLAEEQTPQAKAAWVEDMTARVIEADGDLEEVLEQHGRMGKGPDGREGPGGPGGRPGFDKGRDGGRDFGPRDGGGRRGPGGPGGQEDATQPMPPAPAEEM